MLLVEIRDIPREWWEDDDDETHKLVGTSVLVALKDGYVTISNTGDNLPLKYTRFIQDLDGNMTLKEYNNLKDND